jgi:2',3'-cyclic-nucleotide 3'-phosphodiesterase
LLLGFAVWLVPSAPVTQKLEVIMHWHPDPQASHELEPSSYPHFQPHITLATIPSTTLFSIAASSIPKVPPLPVYFQTLEIGDHFFRSIYIKTQPSEALSHLHTSIHAALGIEPKTVKFPHISLYYIQDADARERVRMRDELGRTGYVKECSDSVKLDCGRDGSNEWIEGFEGSEVWIVDCDGPVEGWKENVRVKIRLSP